MVLIFVDSCTLRNLSRCEISRWLKARVSSYIADCTLDWGNESEDVMKALLTSVMFPFADYDCEKGGL